jgi:ABC-type nickel/cobalt efflux system permease component RcnA
MPDEVSWSGLVALGASGGLVPCESALVLLLSAIALRRVGLGLLLLVAFSLGLAIVLMGIGMLVIYAKHLLPKPKQTGSNRWFQWVPVASAAVVVVLGLLMTGVSLGWLRPAWMAG